MKKQKGITLIALVISIIVMLILAGVSINAIVGENGVLSRAQYSSFMNEMAAVEEAVQLWKAGELIESKGQTSTAIPANGLCKANVLTSAERLSAEIGYYRLWNSRNTMPTEASILSSLDVFNDSYGDELVPYPAGIQDLYYLNNEALNLDKNKIYLIDAATSIVYSTTGITLNGVKCYSTYMAKAVMGNNIAPIFAEAEMSGGGNNIIYAGETYLKDKNGNYIDENGNIVSEENRVINPNGFQIIANNMSHNIYKLYNTGELYGKGVKGTALNTSLDKMEKINAFKWQEWKIPSEITAEVRETVVGVDGAMYFIDINDDLWVLGSNSSNNKFGLTAEQQVEYTGREAMKVELYGKDVKKVFPGGNATFIVTKDNQLYAAGTNTRGQLGLGHSNSTIKFEQVTNIEKVDLIKDIYIDTAEAWMNIIHYSDNTFKFAGIDNFGALGLGKAGTTSNKIFTNIWNGELGDDIDQNIKSLYIGAQSVILKDDGTIWVAGYTGYIMGNLGEGSNYTFRKHNISGVKNIYTTAPYGAAVIMEVINDTGETELWGMTSGNSLGTNYLGTTYPTKLELPEGLKTEGIKEIYPIAGNAAYILSNENKLYGCGHFGYLGMDISSGYTEGIIELNMDNVSSLYSSNIKTNLSSNSILIINKDGKYYTTGHSTLIFRNEMLEKNWTVVATNVKYMDGRGNTYVDKDGNLWVTGDSRYFGLGTQSETYEHIRNFIKCEDENISGKVKEAQTCGPITYVLLENNELWAAGMSVLNGTKYYPGWDSEETQTSYVKILENVAFFGTSPDNYAGHIAIDTNGDAYGWGVNYGGVLGFSGMNNATPYKYNLPTEITEIKKLKFCKFMRSYIVTEGGDLFLSGSWYNGAYNGGHNPTAFFSKNTFNLNLNEGETIKDMVAINDSCSIILTTEGRIFGYGASNRLGIGQNISDNITIRELTGINKVSQIVAGNGFYIAIKDDGTVWGTGTNTYGILGRWIGIDRNSPNSRYKTAFEWVECPELEI